MRPVQSSNVGSVGKGLSGCVVPMVLDSNRDEFVEECVYGSV